MFFGENIIWFYKYENANLTRVIGETHFPFFCELERLFDYFELHISM